MKKYTLYLPAIVIGIFVLLALPFFWPFLLMLLLSTIQLAIPVLLVALLVNMVKKQEREKMQNGKSAAKADKDKAELAQKVQADIVCNPKKLSAVWYEHEGRTCIKRIKDKVVREHSNAFSIDPSGICAVHDKGRYRRVGIIKGYVGKDQTVIEQLLKQDHFKINRSRNGKYLWLYWEG